MPVIWYRLRSEWRTWWRPALAVGLIAGIAGALTLSTIAGASRTRTAFDRLREATAAFDVMVNPDAGTGSALTARAIRRLPQVRDIGRADGVAMVDLNGSTMNQAFGFIPLTSDGRVLYSINRPKLLAGRLPDPRRPNEILVDRTFGRVFHLGIGDVWRPSLITDQVPADVVPDQRLLDELRRGEHPTWTRPLALKIVGVGLDQTNLIVDQGYDFAGIFLTPAFQRTYHPIVPYWGGVVRLHRGASLAAFERAVEGLAPGESIAFQTTGNLRAKFDRAARPQAEALDVFALVVAVTGLLVVGQTLARQSYLNARTHETFRALGVTRGQLFGTAMLRTVPVAVVAAVVAALGAWALSPLLPIGVGRAAEPRPGFDADLTVLGLGTAAIVLVVLALQVVPAWRASRRAESRSQDRPTATSRMLSAIGAPPTMALGIRQALEPGRGATAVPVRTTLTSTVLAVGAVTSAVVLAASLGHLVDTPRLFGWRWDANLEIHSPSPEMKPAAITAAEARVAKESVVQDWTRFSISTVTFDGHPITTIGTEPRRPQPSFAVPTGRLPRTDREVALGSSTMRELGVRIGDGVTARDLDGRPARLRVVGRVVLPGLGTYPGSDKTSPGEGAAVTSSALQALGPQFDADHLILRFRPGSTAGEKRDALRRLTRGSEQDPTTTRSVQQPSDVVAYRDIRSTPLLLAGVLGMLAALTMAHGLVSTIRRRRHEVALLKTLGFTRRQVSATVAWNATTVALVAVGIGVPIGLVLGRWGWIALVDDLGAIAVTVVPGTALLLGGLGLMAVANGVAFVPGRIAARLRPAAALRSE